MNTSYAYCLFKHWDCRDYTSNVIAASYAAVFITIECSLNESRSPLGCHCWITVCVWLGKYCAFNTLRTTQNGRNFAADILKCTFLYTKVCTFIRISLNVLLRVIKSPPAQVMALHSTGDKLFPEPYRPNSPTHIRVSRLQVDRAGG